MRILSGWCNGCLGWGGFCRAGTRTDSYRAKGNLSGWQLEYARVTGRFVVVRNGKFQRIGQIQKSRVKTEKGGGDEQETVFHAGLLGQKGGGA
nr:hypothetical protein [uncultured Acetatifactor sp.]